MLKTVMIIDDAEADRYIAKWSIEERKLANHVIEAKDGREALDMFTDPDKALSQLGEKFPPTLILLDVNMPKMNGFDFLEKFSREKQSRPNLYNSVVVMMFTTSELEADKQKALSYGFVKDFVTKPVDPDNLATIIEKHFA